MPIALIVKWIATAESRGEIAEILRQMRTRTRQEPGCLGYDIYQSPDNPNEFVLVELYKDQEAVSAHGESDHFKEYVIRRAMPVLESRQRSVYSPLD